jgi:hypothetical protein
MRCITMLMVLRSLAKIDFTLSRTLQI